MPAARTSSACRSTSASAAPSRPGSATPGRRATSSRCASTATASTTRRSSASWSRPVLAGEADIAVGSRFLGNGGYRSSAARRVGIRILAWVVSTIARQKVTDPTSGFQALNRRAIGLYAADLPHDYPEVEGLVMAIRHRVRLKEVPVTMREREHGRSSISALGSVYYMVKILLALFVGLFRRRVTPLEDRDGARNMTPLRVSIVATIASLLLLLVVFELIRSRRLRERYALLWLATGVVLLVLSAWRDGLNTIARWVGVTGYPPAVLFAVGLLFVVLVLLHYSTVISRLADQNTILAQRLAILEAKLRERS